MSWAVTAATGDVAAPSPASETSGGLKVTDLGVSYGTRRAVAGATFTVEPGELLGVCGPNGSGKSSLLRAILGLVPATGEVRIGGRPLSAARRDVAHVPQEAQVDWTFPAVVRDVVRMGRLPHTGWLRPRRAADRAAVDAAMDRMAIGALGRRPISELSGGQRRRMLVARALAQGARVLLLDEPFAGVDATTEAVLWRELDALRARGGLAVLVHHDLSGTAQRCDRLLLLNGQVVAAGRPDHVLTPAHLEAAYGRGLWMLNADQQAVLVS